MPTLDLSAEDLALLKHILAQYAPRAEVWAYGSRVTGGAHEGSDLDLVVRYPEGDVGPDIWDLKEALSESELPILVDVHDWALIPESFHREIEKARVRVQG